MQTVFSELNPLVTAGFSVCMNSSRRIFLGTGCALLRRFAAKNLPHKQDRLVWGTRRRWLSRPSGPDSNDIGSKANVSTARAGFNDFLGMALAISHYLL